MFNITLSQRDYLAIPIFSRTLNIRDISKNGLKGYVFAGRFIFCHRLQSASVNDDSLFCPGFKLLRSSEESRDRNSVEVRDLNCSLHTERSGSSLIRSQNYCLNRPVAGYLNIVQGERLRPTDGAQALRDEGVGDFGSHGATLGARAERAPVQSTGRRTPVVSFAHIL